MTNLTTEQLTALVGVVLSLLFNYLPGLADWYAAHEKRWKSLFMLGLLALVTLAIFGAGCLNVLNLLPLGLTVTCDKPGFLGLLMVFIQAVIANQATYIVSPTPSHIQAIKDSRKPNG